MIHDEHVTKMMRQFCDESRKQPPLMEHEHDIHKTQIPRLLV